MDNDLFLFKNYIDLESKKNITIFESFLHLIFVCFYWW